MSEPLEDPCSLVEIDGVVHDVCWHGFTTVLRCTLRKYFGHEWNPVHSDNADKPKKPTCIACMALERST